MTHLSLALIFNLFLITTCVISLFWGGGPEKIGAALNVVASVATTALRLLDARYFAPISVAIFSIDLIVLAGFFWLAVRTTRFWPLWAFGFALADVVLSLAGALFPAVPLFAFHTGLGLYAYLALIAMTSGTISSRRSQHAEPVWRSRTIPPI